MNKFLTNVAIGMLLAFFGWIASVQSVWAGCVTQDNSPIACSVVGDAHFGGGTETPVVVPTKACLEPATYEAIRLNDRSAKWQAGYYYKPGHGEEIITVKNSQCWEFSAKGRIQFMPLGYWVVAYINCPGYYVGWVGAKITGAREVTLVPVEIHLDPNS